ncbi:hypothetical protein IWZ00DRAFT_528639 [Phyllosticta capitalensis]
MDSPNRRLDSKMFQLAPSPIQSAKLKMAVDSSYSNFVQSADDAIRLIALTGSVEDKRQKRPWKNVEQATRSSTPKRLNSSIHDPRSQHRSIAVLVVSFEASSTCDFALANGKAQHDLQRPQDAGQALSGRTFKPWNAAQSAGEQSGEIAVRKLLEADSSHVIRLVVWKKADFGCRVCAGFSMTSGGKPTRPAAGATTLDQPEEHQGDTRTTLEVRRRHCGLQYDDWKHDG